MPMLNRWILLLCFLTGAVTGGFTQRVGDRAKNIRLFSDEGKLMELNGIKSKLLLIDFWASWCGPCRASNKTLRPIYEKYKAQGFEILGISVDANKDSWKRAIKNDQISWLQTIDNSKRETSVATAWNIIQIPTSFLLNADGVIIAVDPSARQLKKILFKTLKKAGNKSSDQDKLSFIKGWICGF